FLLPPVPSGRRARGIAPQPREVRKPIPQAVRPGLLDRPGRGRTPRPRTVSSGSFVAGIPIVLTKSETMNPTRRSFLKASLAGGSLVSAGWTVPGFLGRTAAATLTSEKPGAKDTILVVVQLTGGNDGLNTVVPYADDGYAKHRKTLRLPKNQIKKVNDR